jgi:hypothetical protein
MWAKARDGKRLYVTLPVAGQLAAIDMESFKVIEAIKRLLPVSCQRKQFLGLTPR